MEEGWEDHSGKQEVLQPDKSWIPTRGILGPGEIVLEKLEGVWHVPTGMILEMEFWQHSVSKMVKKWLYKLHEHRSHKLHGTFPVFRWEEKNRDKLWCGHIWNVTKNFLLQLLFWTWLTQSMKTMMWFCWELEGWLRWFSIVLFRAIFAYYFHRPWNL